eukprot:NODE_948_length_2940_cov_0.351989.p5 type:complete len:106 gc:universal NODE_948_length_2940_cov_0.351989:1826-1509(-)
MTFGSVKFSDFLSIDKNLSNRLCTGDQLSPEEIESVNNDASCSIALSSMVLCSFSFIKSIVSSPFAKAVFPSKSAKYISKPIKCNIASFSCWSGMPFFCLINLHL